MAPLPLTIAINDYDHVRDLLSGRVETEGIALTALNFEVEEIFFRFVRFREWDISEMSMGKYVSLRAGGDDSLTAIPVFPSRLFRHSGIYVRSDGAVREARDLKGKRIGVPEWSQTAVIYMVGLLRHEYGVALDEIDWVQAGVNEPGRPEKAARTRRRRNGLSSGRGLGEMVPNVREIAQRHAQGGRARCGDVRASAGEL